MPAPPPTPPHPLKQTNTYSAAHQRGSDEHLQKLAKVRAQGHPHEPVRTHRGQNQASHGDGAKLGGDHGEPANERPTNLRCWCGKLEAGAQKSRAGATGNCKGEADATSCESPIPHLPISHSLPLPASPISNALRWWVVSATQQRVEINPTTN